MTQFKRLRESELEKNLVKKYKVTSQVSTRAFSEINNKIYCHHDDDDDDDDSYTKNEMTIDHVNDDCLAEIFMYIPACERPKIASVCKQWKRALDNYSWFNVKKLELTHWEYDEYPNYLIKHYPTIDGQFNFLKSLLNNCGRYLRELDLTAYSHCNIVPVINESCPNLVKLRIRIEFIDDAILDNAFTGLSKLKVLKIIFQCFSSTYLPVTLINSLLNVADTLTELNLSNWSGRIADNTRFPKEITSVLSELKALKKIQMGGIDCSKRFVDHLLSKSSEIRDRYDECKYQENKIERARTFEKIKELQLRNRKRRVTDDFLYNVANQMRHIHTIHVHCDVITDAGIVAFSKMNHLRVLDLYGYNKVTDSSIKLLKNLFVLNLPFSKKITDKSTIQVLENSPGLNYLGVVKTGVTSELIKKADEISKNRKKQLKLSITAGVVEPNENIKYEYLTLTYFKIKKRRNKK